MHFAARSVYDKICTTSSSSFVGKYLDWFSNQNMHYLALLIITSYAQSIRHFVTLMEKASQHDDISFLGIVFAMSL
jgi:hypothetical protein